jgi:hypothetical protein
MNNASPQSEVLMRAKLLMPTYVGNSQLLDILRHIDDTLTTIDGLYTQLALILTGDIQGALSYEEDARSYLKEYYYTAIHAVSHKQIGDDQSIPTFDQYPFASLANPLLEFNRKSLGKYPVSLQSLTLAAISMGSINIDLLGVGKILEFIEHAVKQIQWEASHEKEMALQTNRLASLEEQLLEQRIIEAHLTNAERRLSIASERIELFGVIQGLDLPLKQKRKLVKSIIDKVELVGIMTDIKIIEKK